MTRKLNYFRKINLQNNNSLKNRRNTQIKSRKDNQKKKDLRDNFNLFKIKINSYNRKFKNLKEKLLKQQKYQKKK